MSTLHFGVVDLAYSDADTPGAQTTYQVAKRLEEEYDVMGTFVRLHEDEIVTAVTDKYRNVLNRVMEGNSGQLNRREWMMPKIESGFRDYLSRDEWQQATGRTIAAAQRGVSHRFKNPERRAKNHGPRPAFIDTGLYRRSFRAWLTP